MQSKSDNKIAEDKVAEELFESRFFSRYQDNLETSMRVSDFPPDFSFDPVQLMYYKCHKVNFRRVGSYIDYLDWIKKSNNKLKI